MYMRKKSFPSPNTDWHLPFPFQQMCLYIRAGSFFVTTGLSLDRWFLRQILVLDQCVLLNAETPLSCVCPGQRERAADWRMFSKRQRGTNRLLLSPKRLTGMKTHKAGRREHFWDAMKINARQRVTSDHFGLHETAFRVGCSFQHVGEEWYYCPAVLKVYMFIFFFEDVEPTKTHKIIKYL